MTLIWRQAEITFFVLQSIWGVESCVQDKEIGGFFPSLPNFDIGKRSKRASAEKKGVQSNTGGTKSLAGFKWEQS